MVRFQGKKVEGNQEGGVDVKKMRTWRQYMNRRGGFNRCVLHGCDSRVRCTNAFITGHLTRSSDAACSLLVGLLHLNDLSVGTL